MKAMKKDTADIRLSQWNATSNIKADIQAAFAGLLELQLTTVCYCIVVD